MRVFILLFASAASAVAPLDTLSYPSCVSEAPGFRDYVKFAASLSKHRDDYDVGRILFALSAIESSYGRFNLPRFEPAFARGGRYFQKSLDEKFGDLAACSLGPWQIMFPNAWLVLRGQVNPEEFLLSDGMTVAAAVASVRWLDEQIIDAGATELEDIADAWNTGSFRDSIKPAPVYYRKVREGWNAWTD